MGFIERVSGRNWGVAALMALALPCTALLWSMGVACAEGPPKAGQLQRLTFSKDESVGYPSMDHAARIVAFRSETIDPKGEKIVSIRVVQVDGLKVKAVFTDGTVFAPAPYQDQFLLCGTKPPLVSGDGRTVIFSLSIGKPDFLEDHYLGLVDAEGSNLRVIALQNEQLAQSDWKKLGFKDTTWRSVSQYRISNDGQRIACLAKGHMGPRNISAPSGILMIRSDGSGQRTLMAPKFGKDGWAWEGYPRQPFTGGGWVFDLSGDGGKLLFGAQSTAGKDDYDLYAMDGEGKGIKRITDLKDRWLVLGETSGDGQVVCFFYSGKKPEGMGTYVLGFQKQDLRLLRSRLTDRVDFREMSGDGKRIFHRVLGVGLAVIDDSGRESLIFDERRETFQDLKAGIDFPSYPSFWVPRFLSFGGDRMLVEAVPSGKDRKELYLLQVTAAGEGVPTTCPTCGRPMESNWKNCPYDGTPLDQGTR